MSNRLSTNREGAGPGRRTALVLISILVLSPATAGRAAGVATAEPEEVAPAPAAGVSRPTDRLLAAETDPVQARLLAEVLRRNPELASLDAMARASAERPDQANSFPDPQATLTGYVNPPETRTGPVEGRATLTQRLPWFGRRGLHAEAETHAALAAEQRFEARRLEIFTEVRVLYFEIAFLDRFADLTRLDRDTLSHFEELARARYSSGVGLQQDAIRIQAEITRVETKLLEIAQRRASAAASLNALRDRSDDTAIPPLMLIDRSAVEIDLPALKRAAVRRRAEVAAAEAETARTGSRVELARKETSPDVTFGLTYALVDPRDDPAGLLLPPEHNGRDEFGLTVGFSLPIHRKRIAAGVNEALERQRSAQHLQRNTITTIHRDVEDLAARIPLLRTQLQLLDGVLVRQSEESLRSVEAAYGSGSVNALDLLDAERVLIEARTAVARSRADFAIAVALLEGVIAGPLSHSSKPEGSQP